MQVSYENYEVVFKSIANRYESKYFWWYCRSVEDFVITANEILETKSVHKEGDVVAAKIILSIIKHDLPDWQSKKEEVAKNIENKQKQFRSRIQKTKTTKSL